MTPRLVVPTIAALAALAGCGGDEPPVPVAVKDACGAGDGKSVVLEGYLRLPEALQISDTAVIRLFAAMGGRGTNVHVEFPIGDGPNQLKDLPAKFSVTSLRVQSADGGTVTINDRVELTAKVSVGDTGCVLREPQVALITG
jgi:hypothetical protein